MDIFLKNDCCWYSVLNVFLTINSGIPTTHVINMTVVVGIISTTMYTVGKQKHKSFEEIIG